MVYLMNIVLFKAHKPSASLYKIMSQSNNPSDEVLYKIPFEHLNFYISYFGFF